MTKKVLMLLSKEFTTDPRVNKEATSLAKNGYELSVISWDRKHLFCSDETVNGISVFRIYNSFLMNLLYHDLFRNPLWWCHAYKKGLELYRNGFDFDVVHCHDLDTLVAGVLLKKKLGVKLVYDAHEIFGHMIEQDMPLVVVRFAFLMEKKLLSFVDRLITADVGYASYFEQLGESPVIIRNCKDLVIDSYVPPAYEMFSVVYIGTLSKSRFFPEVLSVADKIDNVRFLIAGKKEGLFEIVESMAESVDNADFLGTIPLKDVVPLTLKSHVVLCLFDPSNRLNQIGSPNKLFEAMVCGRPIIASKGTYSGKLVEELKIGVSIDFSEKSLIQAVKKLRDDPELCEKYGSNALNAALSKYNWENQEKKLLQLYDELNNK